MDEKPRSLAREEFKNAARRRAEMFSTLKVPKGTVTFGTGVPLKK